jgi:hypothetical protein
MNEQHCLYTSDLISARLEKIKLYDHLKFDTSGDARLADGIYIKIADNVHFLVVSPFLIESLFRAPNDTESSRPQR